MRVKIVFEVENAELLLCSSRQNPPNKRRTVFDGGDTKERADSLARHQPANKASCGIFLRLILSEEQPTSIGTTPFVLLLTEQLLVHDAGLAFGYTLREAAYEAVLGTWSANQMGVEDYFFIDLDWLVIFTVQNILK